MLKERIQVIFAMFALLASGSVLAVTPHLPDLVNPGNRWVVTGFLDQAPGHTPATVQGICFYPMAVVGTHARYYWVSDTFPDWNGIASQEGDQIVMYGDFRGPNGVFPNRGHSVMQWEIVTNNPNNMGAGHWTEWMENPEFGMNEVFANARFDRAGNCDYDDKETALESTQDIVPNTTSPLRP